MAFEETSFPAILNRMIKRVVSEHPDIDVREGSFVYTALAPAALELETLYQELNMFANESFAGTASREGLIKRCEEVGITVREATYAEFKGQFNVQVEIGNRFSNDSYAYTVVEDLGSKDGLYYAKLLCETAGKAPNTVLGNIVPIDYIAGVEQAQLVECLVYGEDDEDTEDLRLRYFRTLGNKGVDGTKAQYELWCEEYEGIGAYEVFPCWNGNNTVKVCILSAENTPASDELVNEFQEHLDPNSTGMGDGIAPIGAKITVVTGNAVPINVYFKATLTEGYPQDDNTTKIVEDAVREYLKSIAFKRDKVSYLGVGGAILNCGAFVEISDLTLNGSANDVILSGSEDIAVLANSNPVSWEVMSN